MGTTSHVIKDCIINHYDCKTHKIWQFTTPIPFLGNGLEWNGVVKLKVGPILGIDENIWAIIQRYIIRVEIVPIATFLGMQA